MNHRLLRSAIALSIAAAVPGCKSCNTPGVDENVSKLVWMKYVHVANVKEMDAPGPNGVTRIAPSSRDGFWAVFDICSLDVQGSALTGFNYDAWQFYVDAGSVNYGKMNPGVVNTGIGVRPSFDPQVREMVRQALSLSPITQYFPKQFYPNLRYRITLFVNEYPAGYQDNQTLVLKYSGHPTMVQNVSQGPPDVRPFFSYLASPQIGGRCP